MTFPTQFKWRPNWKILVFTLLFLPLTVALGFWQLDRAEEKRDILVSLEQRMLMAPLVTADWPFYFDSHLRRALVTASFEGNQNLLLANRSRGNRVGYEVIAVAKVEGSDQPLLVNRGWVLASLDRQELPQLEPLPGSYRLSGQYYCPAANSLVVDQNPDSGWPKVIYHLDSDVLQQVFGQEITPAPCELRLDSDQPLAFEAGWELVNQSPQKHIGYAVQWFLLAIALIILALFANSNLGDLIRRGKSVD